MQYYVTTWVNNREKLILGRSETIEHRNACTCVKSAVYIGMNWRGVRKQTRETTFEITCVKYNSKIMWSYELLQEYRFWDYLDNR